MDIRITLDTTPTLEALLRGLLAHGQHSATEAAETADNEAPAASQSAPVQEPPKEQPKVTFEDLATIAGRLVDAGKKDELVTALQGRLGVTALAFLKPEAYAEALTVMQELEGGESCAE